MDFPQREVFGGVQVWRAITRCVLMMSNVVQKQLLGNLSLLKVCKISGVARPFLMVGHTIVIRFYL